MLPFVVQLGILSWIRFSKDLILLPSAPGTELRKYPLSLSTAERGGAAVLRSLGCVDDGCFLFLLHVLERLY